MEQTELNNELLFRMAVLFSLGKNDDEVASMLSLKSDVVLECKKSAEYIVLEHSAKSLIALSYENGSASKTTTAVKTLLELAGLLSSDGKRCSSNPKGKVRIFSELDEYMFSLYDQAISECK